MDTARRQASGTLATLLGPDALPQDVEARTIGLHRGAQRSLLATSPEALAEIAAFSAGVNAFIAEGDLPAE